MTAVRELSANYQKGIEFYDQGLLIDALAAFQSVLKSADPGSPEARLARFYIGETHARLAEDALARGTRERAEQHLREAIERNPKFPDLHYQLAGIMVEDGAINEAITELETALSLNSNYSKALLLLGILRYEIGKYEIGARHIARAVENEPRYDTPVYQEGMASHFKGEHRRALAQFREMEQTKVDDISFHFGVGKKLYRAADYRGAAEAFEQALSVQSNYADIRNWYGLALMACAENANALEQFQKALEVNPNFVGAVINSGVACEMMGLREDARAFYRRALELDTDNIEAKERLGRL